MAHEINKEMVMIPAHGYINTVEEHGLFHDFNPSTTVLKKGTLLKEGFHKLKNDITFMRDVPVKLRDGVTIYTDIFLPGDYCEGKTYPTLVVWSPYGKSDGSSCERYFRLYNMLGMGNEWNSGLTKVEGPDPDYWCEHGYAVCHPDPRGIAHSEGDITMIGSQEAEDCYDVIEWVAQQKWSDGKTALTGTSYLTFSQWFVAALQPPHLTCLNPHEGLSDTYRDMCFPGGIPDPYFIELLQVNHCSANEGTMREDMCAEMKKYPLASAKLWLDKKADLGKINVPAYFIASYSNTLHTMGTFRSWRRIGSEQKWLRIHDTQEWPDYYSEEATEDRRKFFDHFMKGIDNGWEKTPRVRSALYDFKGGNKLNIPEEEFGYGKDIEYTKYYLNADTRTLEANKIPENESQAEYSVTVVPTRVSFIKTFDEETIFEGYPKLKVFCGVKGHDNMDLFVWVQKIDKMGNILSQMTVPTQSALMQDFTQDGASILRYKGPWGQLRISMRALAADSTDEVPEYAFDKVEKLEEGKVYEAEIALSPTGLIFEKGETLRVVISSDQEVGNGKMPGTAGAIADNKGSHIIYTGGKYASYLQMPLKKA